MNEVLLPAMQEVGEKMASGEIILPFVLQSARGNEGCGRAAGELHVARRRSQPRKNSFGHCRGRCARYRQNLVKTILQNNGYEILDLGKQVPISTIVSRAREFGADAIGLSALLVTTSRQMEFAVEELHRAGLEIPVIIGGAAINRLFARRIS